MISTSNISAAIVGNTLGTSARNLSTLCTHANINMWSKKKPVQLDTATPDRSSNWWRGKFGDCGITPKMVASYRDIPANTDGNLNGWKYLKPTSLYRLADFGGYEHFAEPFISKFSGTETATNKQGSTGGYIILNTLSTPTNLGIEDVSDFKDYYFGVFITNANYSIRVTSTALIKNNGSTVDVNFYAVTPGIYKVYPFLSDTKITQSGGDVAAIYYTVPSIKPIELKIVDSYLDVSLTGSVTGNLIKTAKVTLRVYNYRDTPMTITNNALIFRYANKEMTDPMLIGESRVPMSNVTVPANSYYDYPLVTLDVSEIMLVSGQVRVWVNINSTELTKDFFFA